MSDKELLELAAKAAGVTFTKYKNAFGQWMGPDEGEMGWNPLTDDGDALRLAVQLSLEVSFDGEDEDGRDSQACVGYPESEDRPCKILYLFEPHNRDIFAATRRAIVRAAAEIGKAMK